MLIFYGCSTQQPQVSRGFYTPPGAFADPQKPLSKTESSADNVMPLNAQTQIGMASWYGPGFHGKKTANGEIYDQNDRTAAHRFLPLGTNIKVTNLENGSETTVRINDRGPYVDNRILDLSKRAAAELDSLNDGVVKVRIDVVSFPASFNEKEGLLPYKQVIVQLGVFASSTTADRYQQQMKGKYPAYTIQVEQTKHHYRVFAGPYNRRESAEALASIFKRNGVKHLVRSYQK